MVERARLRAGLDPEFATENRAAGVVLAQGERLLARLRVAQDQVAVEGLALGLEGHESLPSHLRLAVAALGAERLRQSLQQGRVGAIDLAPALNPFKVAYGSRPNMMPMQVVKIFEAEGWVWGGLWSNGDAMHFQAAKIG